MLTDGDTNALAKLRDNMQRNLPAPHPDNSTLVCEQLLWGKDNSQTFLQQHDNEPFQVILASDVIYVPHIIKPLFETVQTLLDPVNGIFLLAFARRQVPVSKEDVLEAATQNGFVYTSPIHDEKRGFFLYALRWKDAAQKDGADE